MTEERQLAFALCNAAAALVEAMGMHAENQNRLSNGHTIAYGEEAFNKLAESRGLYHNQLVESTLRAGA